ncbi:hypothetical protein QYE76_012586 [Lolium multiflorum]|uniref:Reverse transcriptase/retrotransposon-derived protein RNase H-like domain-containing protein n=1 Tax=Lolium multiflorum TaxID=4521 RepID=A0AAD8U178_LOLMU|nr:hypothetical protein QYE76_012586 [Lolium multiflorum]
MKPPTTKKELQRLIGKINFVRRFISNLSGRIEPFMGLVKIKSDEEFRWGAEQQRAFDEIKEYLTKPPVLVPPQQDRPFYIYLSVADTSIASVVVQIYDGLERVVFYLSRRMLDEETRYPEIEKLCLCLFFTCTKLHHILLSAEIVVICKSDVIKHMLSAPVLKGRLALMSDSVEDVTKLRRWSLEKIKENKAKVARAYNKKVRPKEFHVGDLVWEAVLPLGTKDATYGKWSPNWHGPYRVDQVLKGNAYMLEELNGVKFPVAVNGQHLKKYFPIPNLRAGASRRCPRRRRRSCWRAAATSSSLLKPPAGASSSSSSSSSSSDPARKRFAGGYSGGVLLLPLPPRRCRVRRLVDACKCTRPEPQEEGVMRTASFPQKETKVIEPVGAKKHVKVVGGGV